jgi:hypothetical protein
MAAVRGAGVDGADAAKVLLRWEEVIRALVLQAVASVEPSRFGASEDMNFLEVRCCSCRRLSSVATILLS